MAESRMKVKGRTGRIPEGASRLILEVTDENYVELDGGRIQVHLSSINSSGFKGGIRKVKLIFVANKEIKINRIDKDPNEFV